VYAVFKRRPYFSTALRALGYRLSVAGAAAGGDKKNTRTASKRRRWAVGVIALRPVPLARGLKPTIGRQTTFWPLREMLNVQVKKR
jgi:hypothetical protein